MQSPCWHGRSGPPFLLQLLSRELLPEDARTAEDEEVDCMAFMPTDARVGDWEGIVEPETFPCFDLPCLIATSTPGLQKTP